MMHRGFINRVMAATVALMGFMAVGAVQAQPVAGKDYIELGQPQTSSAPGKIEVLEFFWYSCPHCHSLEPSFDAWAKKQGPDVVVRRVPVAFNAGMQAQQRLYYSLEALGKVDELHARVFTAIHTQRQPLTTEKQIKSWIAAQGVDAALFGKTYQSFGVNTSVSRAKSLMDTYGVKGVPAVAVGGKYLTSPSLAGSNAATLQVLDFLIEKTRSGN
ncbi:MAG: thiol:disulfide interchange protein DsbA/DsbL [Pigmentiphaga sp.]|nr:thiol:disulfide interchange protein DsbA/DsbL [Pigmentiphaga sp.]